MSTPVYDFVKNLVPLTPAGESARNDFFKDPTAQFDASWTRAARAVLFAMDRQLLSFYIAQIEGKDLSKEIDAYYATEMNQKWPAKGNPNDEPWPGTSFFSVMRPMSGGGGWSYPTPKIHRVWPTSWIATDGNIRLKLSGEGFLPGAEIELRERKTGFPITKQAVEADWDKKSFHVTHLKASVPIPGAAPLDEYYSVFVRNAGWTQWLTWDAGTFHLKSKA